MMNNIRQIIQISTTSHSDGELSPEERSIIALCNDGSLWEHVLRNGNDGSWHRIEDIPQGDQD